MVFRRKQGYDICSGNRSQSPGSCKDNEYPCETTYYIVVKQMQPKQNNEINRYTCNNLHVYLITPDVTL